MLSLPERFVPFTKKLLLPLCARKMASSIVQSTLCLRRVPATVRQIQSYKATSVILRQSSSKAENKPQDVEANAVQSAEKSKSGQAATAKSTKKTMAQLDEELKAAMEGRAGDGGESGAELEDGKPVSMKRGVRDNMFRYI